VYTLKEGTPLPYYKPIIHDSQGLELVFSQTLKPVLDGRIGWEDEKGHWIFEGPVTPSDLRKRGSETPASGEKTPVSSGKKSVSEGQTPVSVRGTHVSREKTHGSGGKTHVSGEKTRVSGEKTHVSGGKTHGSGGKTHGSGEKAYASGEKTRVSGGKTHFSLELTPDEDLLSFTETPPPPSELCVPPSARTLKKPFSSRKTLSFNNSLDLAGFEDMIENIDTAGVAKFKCKICGFVGESLHFTKIHCELDHTEVFTDTPSSVRSVSEEDTGAASALLEAETKSRPSTRHTNLNWLNNTRSNYRKVVVSKCSEQTRCLKRLYLIVFSEGQVSMKICKNIIGKIEISCKLRHQTSCCWQ